LRGDHRGHPEQDRADEQQLAAADPVTDRTHGDHEAGDHEPVHIHDPQLLAAARTQLRAQLRQGQQHDEDVQGHQQGG
jgi:hypothetical protein